MFRGLEYPLGFFVNINTTDHMAAHYNGNYRARLEFVAASLEGTRINTHWAAASAEA